MPGFSDSLNDVDEDVEIFDKDDYLYFTRNRNKKTLRVVHDQANPERTREELILDSVPLVVPCVGVRS